MKPDILSLIWGIWFVGWMVAGLFSARTIRRESSGSRLLVLAMLAVGFALLINPRVAPEEFARPVFHSTALFDAGLAIMILGLAFTVWARVHLGRLWSGAVTLKEGHELIRSGPYGIVRHPIYTGLVAASVGTALARGTISAIFGLVLICVVCLIKIRAEERLMTEQFPDAYRDYRREVRALIPFVW